MPKETKGIALSKGHKTQATEGSKVEEDRRQNQAQQENMILSQLKENPNLYGYAQTDDVFESTEDTHELIPKKG